MTYLEFIGELEPWGSHRKLLWQALEATVGPVLELGSGRGSTPYLKKYCDEIERPFESYDSDARWANDMGVKWNFGNWNTLTIWEKAWGVCLIDCAPGEYRKVALMKITASIIVIHDSEPVGWNSSDYQVRLLFTQFKYCKDDPSKAKGGPWTTALSNTIDVTKFIV